MIEFHIHVPSIIAGGFIGIIIGVVACMLTPYRNI